MHWPSHTIWLLGSAVSPVYVCGSWGRERWRALSQPHLGTIPARSLASHPLFLTTTQCLTCCRCTIKVCRIQKQVCPGIPWLTGHCLFSQGCGQALDILKLPPDDLELSHPLTCTVCLQTALTGGEVAETWCLGVNGGLQTSVRLFTGSEGEKCLEVVWPLQEQDIYTNQ